MFDGLFSKKVFSEMIARAIIKCRLCSLEQSLPINSRLKRSTQRWHVNGVITVDLVTSVRIIVADTVLDTHGHLYGIRSIRAGVIIPATATGIEFARDVLFASPSAAASVTMGGVWGGRTGWKTADGVTLADLEGGLAAPSVAEPEAS